MDLVDKLLAAVPKDELGFEDIDKFWVATEKLAFPFTQRFKTKLYQLSSSTKKVSAQKRLSGASSVNSSALHDDRHDDSDTDFDYDTSSSVSVVSAVSDGEDDDDLSSIEADESLLQAKSTRSSLASAKASLASSFAEVDTSLAETASVASTRSKRSTASTSAAASANSSTISAASSRRSSSASASRLSNKDDGEAEEEDDDELDDVDDVHADIDPQALLDTSTTTARGRKSSLLSRDSQLLGDALDSDEDKAASSSGGRRSSGASGRRSSAAALATPTGKDDQGRRETRSTRSSLATPKDATPAGGAALSSIKKSRRVSFESELPMDDDDGDLRLEADDETQLTEHSSFQLSPEPSSVAASSRASSATKSTRASTTAMSSLVEESTVVEEEAEEEEQSASTMRVDESDAVDESEADAATASRDMTTTTVASSLPPPADDDYDVADAYGDELSDAEDPAPETSALSHGTDDASAISRRGKRRKSSASEAASSTLTTTPRRVSRSAFDLSTPASHEFKGGRRLSDSTFIATDREDADDDDDDDAAVSDGAASSSDDDDDGGRRRRGGRRPRPTSTSEAGTSPEAATDVSLSFLDQSYLHTISSANKKYAGRKVRAEAALQRRTKQELLQSRRHQRELAAILSDESDVDRLVARAMRQKQTARRTKAAAADGDDDSDDGGAAADAQALEEADEEARHSRRSRRATKGMRFAFWKNERPIYDEGVLVDVVHAEPTPKKPRRNQQQRRAGGATKAATKRGVKRRLIDSDDDDGDAAFDTAATTAAATKKPRHAATTNDGDDDDASIALPTDVSYLEPTTHETLQVWDDYYDRPAPQQVVYVAEAQPAPQPLPVTGERPTSRMDDVGYAAHYFHAPEMAGGTMSGWMAGAVELPPHAIKDAEGVGKYLQVFFVASAQAHALEFGLADPSQDAWIDGTAQRLLLSAGDSFYVPPGNIYRLENHSPTTTARLFWMIVYPVEDAAVVRGSSVSEHTVVSGVSY